MIFQMVFGDAIMLDRSAVDVYFLVVGMYFVIILAVAIKLLKSWYTKQQAVQQLFTEKLEAELKMLKSQIHPHFLFNTLNNIYALAMKKSDEAPDMIVKLSEILDFLLYESQAEIVGVEREIEMLNNYIDLEKIRYGERLSIDFKIEGDYQNRVIAPMLLLPFVENSFKHGASGLRDKAWIKIHLVLDSENLKFSVDNNIAENKDKNSTGGIGLENVRKRLDLTYPGQYTLNIDESAGTYSVGLSIQNYQSVAAK
jgi:LytS/YehU family sensor histidine kinase